MVNDRARRRSALTCCVLAGLATFPAVAMELGLPLACTPREDCWLVRLVDHDPGPGFTDHRCGTLGSDGHDGTDFAIADPARMAAGVPVLAAAAGEVVGVRDGMPDQAPEGRLVHPFGDRNCGNGVALRHGDGWETQYCHLRQGSVRVATGDRVGAGQELGLVGMSGEANFPHVHLAVRRHGQEVDPFTGAPAAGRCGEAGTPLWAPALLAALDYQEVPIAVLGLTDRLPDRDAIVAGRAGAATLSAAAPALVGYVLAYGLRPGDRLELTIQGPDGSEVSRSGFDFAEEAPRATRAAGRRAPPEGWPPGTYRVEARVRRGERTFARAAAFTVLQ
jgi:murein DD-endopeptidase MepM/ murein hydrolase activator NlpD